MGRDLELQKLQALDRTFFPPAAARGRGSYTGDSLDDAGLPPINQRVSTHEGARLPPLPSRQGTTDFDMSRSGTARARSFEAAQQQAARPVRMSKGPFKPSKRKQHMNTLLYGVNPANPFEAVVEASPAMRNLAPRDWKQLQLLLPGGCSREVVVQLESELAQFLHENTSATGGRVDHSPPRSPLAAGLPLRLGAAAAGAAAGQAAAAAAAATGSASPTAYGGLLPPTPGSAWAQAQGADAQWLSSIGAWGGSTGAWSPQLNSSLSAPTSAATSRFSSPPRERTGTAGTVGAGHELHEGPLWQWASPPVMSPERELPLSGPNEWLVPVEGLLPHQASALRYGTNAGHLPEVSLSSSQPLGSAAEPAQLSSSVLLGGGDGTHGHPSIGLYVPAGYGAGISAAGATLAGTALLPTDGSVTLSKLMSERQSVRRHVQLVAQWLEGAVGRLWDMHSPEINDLSMRATFSAAGGKAPSAFAVSSAPGGDAQTQSLPSPIAGTARQDAGHASGGMNTIPEELEGEVSQLSAAAAQQQQQRVGTQASEAGHSVNTAWQQSQGPFMTPEVAAVLGALGGAANHGPAFDPAAKKGHLAAQFASFVSSSLSAQAAQGGAAWARSQKLWAEMLQVVGAASGALVQHVGAACWEEGALLSRLWNLHTALMDAGCGAAHAAAARAEAEAAALREQVRRLDPLIEWDRAAREEIESLRDELGSAKASLHLASAERDALLRENDKIIIYYKRELKRLRHEQRRSAWRLAKKLKNAQEQLGLMQRDRDRLVDAVSYTKGQAFNMVSMVQNVNTHFQRFTDHQKSMYGRDMEVELPGLRDIEAGLQGMVVTVHKVQEVNQEAEEHHFQVEEKVTAVAAADTMEDDLVDAVLAGGDPDSKGVEELGAEVPELEPPRTNLAAIQAAAARKLREEEEEEEEEEDVEEEYSPKTRVAMEWVEGDRHDMEVLYDDTEDQPATAPLPEPEPAPLVLPSPSIAPSPSGRSPSKGGAGQRLTTPDSRNGSRTAAHKPGVEAGVQTGPELLEGLVPPDSKHESMAGNKQQPQLRAVPTVQVQEAAEELVISHIAEDLGVDLSAHMSHASQPEPPSGSTSPVPPLALTPLQSESSLPTITPRTANAMKALVQGVQDKLEHMEEELAARTRDAEKYQAKVEQLADDLDEKVRDVNMTRRQLDTVTSTYTTLRNRLHDIGINPDNPVLPKPSTPPSVPAVLNPYPPPPPSPSKQLAGLSSQVGAPLPTSWVAEHEDEVGEDKGKKKGGKKKSRSSSPAKEKKTKAKEAAPVLMPLPTAPVAPPPLHSPSRVRPEPVAQPRPVTPPKEVASRPAPAPFMLGKDRVVERKQEATGVERLADAVAKYDGIKPRTLDWLLKLINDMYKGKMASDEMRAKQTPPQEPLPLVDYMFQHLAGVYGTRDLVNQYAAQVVATIKGTIKLDPRVALFNRFLTENLPRKVMLVFLDALKKLNEPARLPCCDFPPEWAPKKGAPPFADVRKCLWVADKVLMRRHTKTAYTFAAALAVKGEPVGDSELNQYFVAPGYYGTDVAQMREYERGRAEFRRITTVTFLEAVCEEYLRCEGVFLEVLPSLFQKWDTDNDSVMQRADVGPMFAHMAPQGTTAEELEKEAVVFWVNALRSENEGIASGLASMGMPLAAPPSQSGTAGDSTSAAMRPPSGRPTTASHMISVKAFIDAGLKSDVMRAYVRLHKTPPAKLRVENTDDEQVRLLLQVLINRHWAMHGPSLTRSFADAGSTAAQLAMQAQALERERDGARKALALHGLLKMMIGRKLDRLVAQLSPDSLTQSVDADFEDGLNRLTTAVKVLYGANAIVVEELLEHMHDARAPVTSVIVHMQRQRQVAQVISLYATIRGMMQEYALAFLRNHEGIHFWVQKWRARARRRTGAKSARSLARGGGNGMTPSTPRSEDPDMGDDSDELGENGAMGVLGAASAESPLTIAIPTNVRQASAGKTQGPAGSLVSLPEGGEPSFQVQGQ